MNNEEELYQRCIELERKGYALEDKIQEMLDYLLKTHITLEEMEEVQRIATGEKTEYKVLTRDTTIQELMEAFGIKGKKEKENKNEQSYVNRSLD